MPILRFAKLAAAVALEVHRGQRSVAEIASSFDVKVEDATRWHELLCERAESIFEYRQPEVGNVESVARVIAETATQALAVLDDAGVCVYANRAFVELFGYSRSELSRAPLHDLIHHHTQDGEVYPSAVCPLVIAAETGCGVTNLSDVFFKKDGSAVKIVCSANALVGEQGRRMLVLEARDVTEQLELERNLSLDRNRLQKLFSANLIGVIYWNLHGEIEDANAEFLRMVKYTHDDLINQRIDWRRMTPEEFKKGDEEGVRQLLTVGSHPAMEKQYICKDGSRVWIAVSSAMVDHPHGVAFVQDISQRKYAEAALKAAEQAAITEAARSAQANARLSALLEAAPVGIGMCDERGKLVVINRWNRLLWGENLPTSENVEEYAEWKGWWADGSEKHGQPLKAQDWAMARALGGEEAPKDRIEIEPFDAPGTRKTILNCGAPIRDEGGSIVGAVVAQVDITDQVRADAALKESEQKFRTITDAMPQMVFSALPDGYNDYLNKHLYDFTGAPLGSLEGTGWHQVIHPDDVGYSLLRWEQSLETGEPFEIKYRVRHRSGEYRWALGRALPVRDDQGKVIRWLGTCTDIHDQIMVQEALEEADRKKDDFIALLAHELRNPLAPLRTALDLFKLKQLDEPALVRAVQIMDRQTKQMSSLIDDLLDVARITRGKVALKIEAINLQQLLRNVCADHREGMISAGVDLSLHASEQLWLNGDVIRLNQVFGNLLSNACKYSQPGTHVSVTACREIVGNTTCAKVTVEDNGKGMCGELIKELFKPFTQAEERSSQLNGGLGLGLAIVKGLVELHGGSVSAESPGLNLGSTFTVVLPLTTNPKLAVDMRSQEMIETKAKTVLLIDDNADFVTTLSGALEYFGNTVVTASTGTIGVEHFKKHEPDVVICDIGLPEMTGYEVVEALRTLCSSSTRQPMMIALSGYGQETDKMKAVEAGFDKHFTKPVNLEELITALER